MLCNNFKEMYFQLFFRQIIRQIVLSSFEIKAV